MRLEPSEYWDDDLEFGPGNGKPSTSRIRNGHTNHLCTRPSKDTQHRPSSTGNGRTFSTASSTMEDWNLPDTLDTNHPTTTEQTENLDDGFEVETRNNSLRKLQVSTPRRRDV